MILLSQIGIPRKVFYTLVLMLKTLFGTKNINTIYIVCIIITNFLTYV